MRLRVSIPIRVESTHQNLLDLRHVSHLHDISVCGQHPVPIQEVLSVLDHVLLHRVVATHGVVALLGRASSSSASAVSASSRYYAGLHAKGGEPGNTDTHTDTRNLMSLSVPHGFTSDMHSLVPVAEVISVVI